MAIGVQKYTLPSVVPPDNFAYEGVWDIANQSAGAQKSSALLVHFKAGKVFLVIGPGVKGNQINVMIDGKPINEAIAGADVKDGRITLDEERLYNIVDLKGKVEDHLLRLEFEKNGIRVYAFTFG